MNVARLTLLVLETHQLDRLRELYAALGISFAEERRLPPNKRPRPPSATSAPRRRP